MHYFFDRNFPKRVFQVIKLVDESNIHINAHHHDELFDQDTKDTEWISKIKLIDENIVIVGGDAAILRRQVEADALRSTGLTYFILSDGFCNGDIYQKTERFFRVWPKIQKKCRMQHCRSVYVVTASGEIKEKIPTSMVGVRRSDGVRCDAQSNASVQS